jgi:hypothetical protein
MEIHYYEVHGYVSMFSKLSNFMKFLGRKKEAGLMGVRLDNRLEQLRSPFACSLPKPGQIRLSNKSLRWSDYRNQAAAPGAGGGAAPSGQRFRLCLSFFLVLRF